jgi:PAS domain S-box-containing protein
MRDQHRPKQDLVDEVVALRKQVADLREEMTARRRVEEALRHSEEQLRALVDGSPAGLCLFRPDGAAIAVSSQFARMLGYESAAELLSTSQVVGVFASGAERVRVAQLIERGEERVGDVLFRRKNGGPHASWVMGAACKDPDAVALVVLETLSPACSGDRHSE